MVNDSIAEKYQVLVSTSHPGPAVALLRQRTQLTSNDSPEPLNAPELLGKLTGKDALISVLEDKITAELLQKCPDLKVVANVAVGFDNIDVAAANKHGVLVLNTPGVLDNATADLAMSLLLCTARRLLEGDRYLRSGRWTKWRSDLLLGHCLEGKTLGVIGLGRIGQTLAKRARAFEMNVIYSQRNRASKSVEERLDATHVSLNELLQTADAISIHCPLTADTRHLIGRDQFALMKPSCLLINTARGPIIDEKALVDALAAGRIAGAGLDVYEFEPKVTPELVSMDNVVLAPHIGSATTETRSMMVQLAVDGLLTALSGQLPVNVVNPDVWPIVSQRLAIPAAVK